MNKRKIIISALGIGLLVGGFMLAGVFASAGDEQAAPVAAKPAAAIVRTQQVQNGELKSSINITGRVIPAERVDLYAEVNALSRYGQKPFKAGTSFKKGEVLLRLDGRELQSSMASIKSQFMSSLAQVLPDLKLDYPAVYDRWKEYLLQMEVNEQLAALPEVADEQLRLFLTGRNVYASYYSIRELETRLSKYRIVAPFTGTLTESNINDGALVRTGQKLGELIKTGQYELEGSVMFDQLSSMKLGQQINFREVNSGKRYSGTLTRINEKVDPATQLVKVYFAMDDSQLKSGLYLEGAIAAYTIPNAVKLPIQALVEEGAVFIMQEGTAVKQAVMVQSQGADYFIVSGLADGTKVIIDKKNSSFEGSAVIEMP